MIFNAMIMTQFSYLIAVPHMLFDFGQNENYSTGFLLTSLIKTVFIKIL